MLTKKLFVLALLSALGLSMSAAQAQGFDHRDGNRGFHNTDRHAHHARHHGHRHSHHNRGHR